MCARVRNRVKSINCIAHRQPTAAAFEPSRARCILARCWDARAVSLRPVERRGASAGHCCTDSRAAPVRTNTQ